MSRNETKGIRGLSRRNVLAAAAGIGTVSLAGCGGLLPGGGDSGVDPVQSRVTVDPGDIVEGGTFRTAIGANVDTFDVPFSSEAAASAAQNLLFEGMITVGADGEIYPWLAESIEQEDVQDVGEADYTDYMQEIEYAESEEGRVFLDTSEQIVVRDPDNPSQPEAGDTGGVLTTSDTQAAIDDNTYGMHFQAELHEGINFHNGEELTADNVVASYYRYEGSPNAGQIFDSLLHVEADGDYTVNIYAQEPDAAGLRELGGLDVYPSEITDLDSRQADPREGNTPAGTGAFEFAEFEGEEFLRVEAFDDYWFDTDMKDWFEGPDDFPNGPVVDEVEVNILPDDSTRSAALQNDELDMAYGLTSDDLTDFRNSEDFRTAATDGAGYTFLQFPVNSEPWNSRQLRKAVNHLIPRKQISTEIFNEWESPAWTPLPPVAARAGSEDYEAQVENHREENESNEDRAQTLIENVIEEKGLETPIEVTLETNSDNNDRVQTMELITESLNQFEDDDENAYFDAELTTREFGGFVVDLISGEYPEKERLAFIGLSGGFNPHGYAKAVHHPENFMGCCNFQNIDIQELNEALADARYGVDVAEDPDLRRERYGKVWDLVLKHNANSYGTHSTVVGIVQNDVKGFNSYPSSQDIIGYGLFAPEDEQITYLDN